MRYILATVIVLLCLPLSAQDMNDKIRATLNEQAALDSSYANAGESPLLPEDLEVFEGLPFYAVDTNWYITAHLIRTPDEKPFEMATSTDRKPLYRKFGYIEFEYMDSTCRLNLYQSLDLKNRPGFEDYLFLPFGDRTNGTSTYGGGRYLDLRIPGGDTLEIDFNRCYNPYCAYNHRYSCPKIPLENILNIPVRAGVKAHAHEQNH